MKNKIIVVGHPQSGLERVYELLLACGMAQALPSRREGLTPAHISATLVKAHGAVPVQQVRSADELQQIAVAPVWQGLALDLVLANMDQTLWGWADVQAVYLLDYWKTQDPQAMFVLVYDAPQTALTRHAVEHLATDPEALQAQVNAWMAYNAALLSFHLRNPERSLLVHANQVQQVQASAQHYVQQLSARMDAPLHLPVVSQGPLSTLAPDDGTRAVAPPQPVPQAGAGAGAGAGAEAVTACADRLQSNPLAQWLALQLLQEHPEAEALYAQLQAAASIPLRTQQQGNALLAPHDVQQRYQVWASFVAQQMAMQQSAVRLEQLDSALHDKQQQLHERSRQIEQLQQTQLDNQHRIHEQEQQLQENEQENELLLTQLHQVQEELESRYLQSEEQAKKLAELPKLQADLKAAQEKATKLQQAEAQLKKELQQAKAQPASAELQEENELLLTQLHQVQEELESRYLQSEEQAKKLAELPKLQADLKAAQEKATKLQQAEAQLKKELQQAKAQPASAELQEENELLLTQLHQVQEELERYYLENRQLKAGGAKKPPPPAKQAYYGAADRVKQQLSYRLGATMIAQSRSVGGWLRMPFALNAEIKRFKQDQAARAHHKLPPIAQYRDAHEAERIKQHLSYRLGARMIANSKTVGGWVTMPWALLEETKAFRKERQLR